MFKTKNVNGLHARNVSVSSRFKQLIYFQTANNLYEDHAFLLNKPAVIFMSQVLNLLVENEVPLDSSLLRGFDSLIKV